MKPKTKMSEAKTAVLEPVIKEFIITKAIWKEIIIFHFFEVSKLICSKDFKVELKKLFALFFKEISHLLERSFKDFQFAC